MRRRSRRPTRADPLRMGFSLVELIVVIVIMGVIAVSLSGFISRPLLGAHDLLRRAELVDLAGQSVQRLSRDLRAALPNSVRVDPGGQAIEFLRITAGARFRRQRGTNDPGGPGEVDHTDASDRLEFGGDTEFNLLSRLDALSFSYGTALPSGTRLAVYSTGTGVYADAAAASNPGSITPASTLITITNDSDEEHVSLSSSFQFERESPTQRLYVVDEPVSYLCNATAGTLTRISGYTISSGQPSDPSASPLSGGTSSLVADQIESCSFNYVAGSAHRAGLVTIVLAIEASGERVRLLQQVHVSNAP